MILCGRNYGNAKCPQKSEYFGGAFAMSTYRAGPTYIDDTLIRSALVIHVERVMKRPTMLYWNALMHDSSGLVSASLLVSNYQP